MKQRLKHTTDSIRWSYHHVFLALWLLASGLYGCSEMIDDELQLRDKLDALIGALEEREMDHFINLVASDFSAGQLDRRSLRWLVQQQWQQRGDFSIQLADIQIELLETLDPPRARVHFQALTSGQESLVPSELGWYTVETAWRKEEGVHWKLISADWQRRL